MKNIKNHISIIIIHLLFWVLFVCVSLFIFSNYYWKENPFLHYFFILLGIVYLNNLVLLPYFITKKYYILYTILISIIAFLGTQAYCNYFALCGCSILKCLSDYLWQTLVPIIFFSFLWMLFRYIEKEKEIEKIQKENTEKELQYLKSQINPHVLFNNLNTIYSYALESPQKVPELILMLSDNLKHVLYESTTKFVELEKEIAYINNYIAFQKIRTEGIKTIEFSTELDTINHKIAPLLLITLIENAFTHSATKSTIQISIVIRQGELQLQCINKIAIRNQSNPKESIGLENLKKRLVLLYPNTHELSITKTDDFRVTLKLQLA